MRRILLRHARPRLRRSVRVETSDFLLGMAETIRRLRDPALLKRCVCCTITGRCNHVLSQWRQVARASHPQSAPEEARSGATDQEQGPAATDEKVESEGAAINWVNRYHCSSYCC